jgi:hypothetical protein
MARTDGCAGIARRILAQPHGYGVVCNPLGRYLIVWLVLEGGGPLAGSGNAPQSVAASWCARSAPKYGVAFLYVREQRSSTVPKTLQGGGATSSRLVSGTPSTSLRMMLLKPFSSASGVLDVGWLAHVPADPARSDLPAQFHGPRIPRLAPFYVPKQILKRDVMTKCPAIFSLAAMVNVSAT